MPAYFFSDAHLGVNPPKSIEDREERFVKQLKNCFNASHIVIAGDLFEFWYEYKYYVTCEHMPLFRVLGDLVDAGVQVHYLMGNHDFALGDFFEKSLGVHTSRDLVLEIQGKKLYFVHGDGLAKSDSGYRFFRKVIDFPLNRKLFSLLHPDWGMGLAHFVGHRSRKYGESRELKLDEYLAYGNSKLNELDADYFIHGHHHLPGIWPVQNGVVASPGQWLFTLNYLKLEDGELELVNVQAD